LAPVVPVVNESDSLDAALERLQASGRRAVPVVADGRLVGMLPLDNVMYVLQLREKSRGGLARGGL
jgi:CBS domain-containing protein